MLRREVKWIQRCSFHQVRKVLFGVRCRYSGNFVEPVERKCSTSNLEHGAGLFVGSLEENLRTMPACGCHLARNKPRPDQLVETSLILINRCRQRVRMATSIGWTNGFVGFLKSLRQLELTVRPSRSKQTKKGRDRLNTESHFMVKSQMVFPTP